MIRSAVTVSLVDEARGGPFVFWDSLEQAFQTAAELGFDAIEIFAPSPDLISTEQILELCSSFGLNIAALGTGAGMVKHGLSLTAADPAVRERAMEFVKGMIQFGSFLRAPIIIGSMQGRFNSQVTRQQALGLLRESLGELGDFASQQQIELFFEPLNRYETNLIRTLSEGCSLLDSVAKPNVKLLADLFHANIEEACVPHALIEAAPRLGHVHFVDSNRQAPGLGHIDFPPIIQALKQVGFQGYLSAEALPLPDSVTAAKKTIETFRQLLANQ